jgi:hypothetical protein
MFNAFLVVFIPLLLVFGLYHLLTWFNVFGINDRAFWRRAGLAAAVSHFLLATGFFAFTWFDLQGNRVYAVLGMTYERFLLEHSSFWQLLGIFDTLAMLGTLAAFSIMDRMGVNEGVLAVALGMTYIVGTLQWYYVGGGVGAVVQKVWDGLKTGEDGEEWFQ